ncbi:MAG TPA: glycosyl hydrolase [Puia sp.]|nr:glycosyl hydrolase [Puia sp.]
MVKLNCVIAAMTFFTIAAHSQNPADTIVVDYGAAHKNIRLPIPAHIHHYTVDLSATEGPLSPFWAYFGYDEPNYTYMKDGRKLLSEIAALSPVPVYVRCHNLLTTGDGEAALKWGSTNAYTEDAKGRPVYNWHIVDSIFDTYVQRGMRPLAEIGFMPEALSIHPQPYRHHWKPGVRYDSVYTGWAWPPDDYNKWEELVFQWVSHCVKRYGKKEVSTWLWEVWNEPNIGYWKGTPEEYCKLYDYAAQAVKRALPGARVGGPATTGPGWDKAAVWLKDFLVHCSEGTNAVTGRKGTPLDFVSFHAKGSPKLVEGHVRMNMAPQLKDAADGFAIVASSIYKDLPVYITECDPEGCAACGMATNPENAYRNGTMYSSYTAASFAKIYNLALQKKIRLGGLISWSFEFEDQKWFDGFRDLATNGVDKPVLNVFRMYGMMRGNRLKIGVRGEAGGEAGGGSGRDFVGGVGVVPGAFAGGEVGALASGDAHSLSVMSWNYWADDIAGGPDTLQLAFIGLPQGKIRLTRYSIDRQHSNAYERWKEMGSPQKVTDEQYRQLEQSGQLQREGEPLSLDTSDGKASYLLVLPAGAVSLLRLEY